MRFKRAHPYHEMEKKRMKNKNLWRQTVCIIFLLITGLCVNMSAQEMPVPADMQAALFKKIFAFDKTLQSKGDIELVILTADGSADEIESAFKKANVKVKVIRGNQVPSDATVVYVMPGVDSPKQQTSQKGILSISGVTNFVENGKVSIGLGIEGGKPKIIINISQVKAEGHELSADLLKIAKIIQ